MGGAGFSDEQKNVNLHYVYTQCFPILFGWGFRVAKPSQDCGMIVDLSDIDFVCLDPRVLVKLNELLVYNTHTLRV